MFELILCAVFGVASLSGLVLLFDHCAGETRSLVMLKVWRSLSFVFGFLLAVFIFYIFLVLGVPANG